MTIFKKLIGYFRKKEKNALVVGNAVCFRGLTLDITKINIIIENVGGHDFIITEYVLEDKLTLTDYAESRLWIYPEGNGFFFNVDWDGSWNEAGDIGLRNALGDGSGLLWNGGKIYSRRFDLLTHEIVVDGEYGNYWDYEFEDEVLFVLEDADGWFYVLIGSEINFEDIIVL